MLKIDFTDQTDRVLFKDEELQLVKLDTSKNVSAYVSLLGNSKKLPNFELRNLGIIFVNNDMEIIGYYDYRTEVKNKIKCYRIYIPVNNLEVEGYWFKGDRFQLNKDSYVSVTDILKLHQFRKELLFL